MHDFALTPTPFLGRTQEIAEIGALLDDSSCRLLTLVGPGGIGKTRLALEVASHQRAAFNVATLLEGRVPRDAQRVTSK